MGGADLISVTLLQMVGCRWWCALKRMQWRLRWTQQERRGLQPTILQDWERVSYHNTFHPVPAPMAFTVELHMKMERRAV